MLGLSERKLRNVDRRNVLPTGHLYAGNLLFSLLYPGIFANVLLYLLPDLQALTKLIRLNYFSKRGVIDEAILVLVLLW